MVTLKNNLTADSLGLVKMERYTWSVIAQRVFIIEQHFKNNESLVTAIVRNFVKRFIEKFRVTGSVGDAKHTSHPKTSCPNVNSQQSVGDNPGTSIWRRGQELQFSRSSLQRIVTKDMCLYAYSIQLTQQLNPNGHSQRREFLEWIIEHQ